MASDYDWVVVDTVVDMEGFSASRPPQHNIRNLSSTQVADTSADESLLAAEVETLMKLGPSYDPCTKKAPTVETMASDDTLKDNTKADNGPPARRLAPLADCGLTKNSLEPYGHETDTRKAGDLGRWLESAAPGFTRHCVAAAAAAAAVVVASRESNSYRSKQSHAAATDGSSDPVSHADAAGSVTNDIRAAGGQFDDESITFVYASACLSLD
ncbi:hypothetical protein QBC33DRAFT_307496 [Phialemonium atrogriseum]|uniref:Uncharacterized protein n=1 Tax=Phialemonium atrogriseum TaxID=1093897 RepID=A0AAJ0C950_9PEZI|nr:uncharacterized protein QBC33DRAFT_307496 [Phialemonium atrogriseum]KAK1769971.1 hypothetical protein QBC33DRAFT_307496 [Phialemonium atrogriseum]